MSVLDSALSGIGKGIAKHSNLIFAALAVCGVGVVGYLSSRDTKKHIESMKEFDTPSTSRKDIVIQTAKDYAPTLVAGSLAVGAITANYIFNKKAVNGLMALYTTTALGYSQFVKATEEAVDPEMTNDIRSIIADDTAEHSSSVNEPQDGKELFYDEVSNQFFWSTEKDILKGLLQVERVLAEENIVLTSIYYHFLGIKPTEDASLYAWDSDTIEWSNEYVNYLDFDILEKVTDKGLKYKSIHPFASPNLMFENWMDKEDIYDYIEIYIQTLDFNRSFRHKVTMWDRYKETLYQNEIKKENKNEIFRN